MRFFLSEILFMRLFRFSFFRAFLAFPLGFGILAVAGLGGCGSVAFAKNFGARTTASEETVRSFNMTSEPAVVIPEHFEIPQFYDFDLLQRFYSARALEPIWFQGSSRSQKRVRGVLTILEKAWTHGLNPEDYHVSQIRIALAMPPKERSLAMDKMVSDAVIRYVRDLTGMRHAGKVPQYSARYWRHPVDPHLLLREMADSNNPLSLIENYEPNDPLYVRVREALIDLVTGGQDTDDDRPLTATLTPGQTHPEVSVLRRKLGGGRGAPSDFYDPQLAAVVARVQAQSALEPDGVVGASTRAVLNKSKKEKIIQLAVNMERLRWMDPAKPSRYILVNIPSANLWAVEGGRSVLEMPVVVGKTARPTYSFKAEITGVRFNPTWTVPRTIKQEDFLPALREDPLALKKKGITLYHNGKTVDPSSVDWATVPDKNIHDIRMMQAAGEGNPLGRVRVIMPNPYDIYLHDTNHKELFAYGERNLSSGCVRVSKPEELAFFILSHNPDWSKKRQQALIGAGRTVDVPTAEPLPVYITYQTIWLDSDKNVVYGNDVYGQDARLASVLLSDSSFEKLLAEDFFSK